MVVITLYFVNIFQFVRQFFTIFSGYAVNDTALIFESVVQKLLNVLIDIFEFFLLSDLVK